MPFSIYNNYQDTIPDIIKENALLPKNVELGNTINTIWISKINGGFD
ncbi:MAG: hypothetical protein IRD3MM_06700 [Candidatus Midichloria mitochondrii]|nr:hypothetical protein [Candidatus Midichloria mitochondrii]MDJ1288517.1 hypothetical protein [Candidatus Midichloria mitochondrii]MDJ1299361.1 hypothetical protein [Candidatus Midichloria mitochondrii]